MENQRISPRTRRSPRNPNNLYNPEQLALNTQPELVVNDAEQPRETQNIEPEKVFISCDKLVFNEDQPFRLYNKEQLVDLAVRIKRSGLLHPIIVRPAADGKYEILSGRNRARAVRMNGDKEIAAFIRDVDDDEAQMIMLNANLGQRENLLPSEKARAYSLEAELLNRNGKRPDITLGKDYQSYDARKIMSEKHNESGRSIANYIMIAKIIREVTPKKRTKKEYIKFDKSKFTQFMNVINNTPNLEQLFIEFLKSRNRNLSLNNLQNGGGNHATQSKRS